MVNANKPTLQFAVDGQVLTNIAAFNWVSGNNSPGCLNITSNIRFNKVSFSKTGAMPGIQVIQ